jgi:hypothetical protein
MNDRVQSDRVRECALLGITVAGLFLANALEHFIIHRQVLMPGIAAGVPPAPWMWAAMFIPELVVCFAAGWRLRGPLAVLTYAAVASAHRGVWMWVLARSHEPGHSFSAPSVEIVAALITYVAVFWVASSSSRTPGFVPAPGE